MVAAVGGAAAHAVIGGAAELAAPDDERAIEQAALFEIGDESGDGLVDAADEIAMSALDVVMAVPRAVVELHEAHAFFHQLASEETFATEGVGGVAADAVEILGGLGFLREVEGLGDLHLHAEGELVVIHARSEFVEAGMLRGVGGVELGDEIEVLALTLRGDAGGGREIEDRRTLGAEGGALKTRGQVTIAPIGRAALRIGNFGENDEAGEILVEGAEAVVDPSPEAGIAAKAVATVHLIHRGRMVDAVDLAAAVEAEIVGDAGEVGPVRRHVGAALAGLDKFERTADVVAFAALHRGFLFPLAGEFIEVELGEHRLRVERVDVRGPALHHEKNAVLRFSGEVAGARRERIDFLGRAGGGRKQSGKCDAAEARAEAVKEVAPSRRVECAGAGAGEIGISRHTKIRWR